jgi:hypothetical protein
MATSGVEDVRDNILGGSFTFFEDSMRDWTLGLAISIQHLSYSFSKSSTRLALSKMFFLLVLDHFPP